MRAQSCLTFCDSMDHSPPGSSVHGIFQARILEWVAMSSGNLLNSGIESVSPKLQADSLPLSHQESPWQVGSVPTRRLQES